MKLAGHRFVTPTQVETQVFDWGTIKWLSEPRITAKVRFAMGVVLLQAGKGHERHNHPGSEEILYVISGQGNQMIDIDGEQWDNQAVFAFRLARDKRATWLRHIPRRVPARLSPRSTNYEASLYRRSNACA